MDVVLHIARRFAPRRCPNQRAHQPKRQPKSRRQRRRRLPQQHHRHRRPPSVPRARPLLPRPCPRKHANHQHAAQRRHIKPRQSRINHRRRPAHRRSPHARRLRHTRQHAQQQRCQPSRQPAHHAHVQARNAQQMIQPQRTHRRPSLRRHAAFIAHRQRAHQPRPLRITRRRALPSVHHRFALPIKPRPPRPFRQPETLLCQRSRAIQTICQRPRFAVKPHRIAHPHRRLYPRLHLPHFAHAPIPRRIIRKQQPIRPPIIRLPHTHKARSAQLIALGQPRNRHAQ